MPNLTLYNYFRSSTSFRTRIALNLKGLDYSYKPVHLINNGGEQNSPEFRSLNPMGGVPTLIHDGHVISQSFAIIEYLDEAFKQGLQLFPGDSLKKAKIREFCQIINADIHSYGNLKTLQYLQKNFKATDAEKNQWIKDFFTSGLQACEKILETTSGSFCFGDQITAAECFLIPVLFTAQRFNVPLNDFKNSLRINNECLSIEAFKKAHPFRQPDTPNELKV